MISRNEAIAFCLSMPDSYEDYPFDDANWTVMRHKSNKKIFACIFERSGRIWINVKGRPEQCDFWRSVFESIIPAYHMNKIHWNSIILDGSVPEDTIKNLISESYELTKKRIRKSGPPR